MGNIWERASDPTIRANTKRDLLADRIMSLERYVEVILEAKSAGLPVLLGLEVDFFPDNIDAVLELIDPYPRDLLLGSIHWIDGWWFDRSHSKLEWERLGPRHVYERYFELLSEMAVSGKVDVIPTQIGSSTCASPSGPSQTTSMPASSRPPSRQMQQSRSTRVDSVTRYTRSTHHLHSSR